MATNCKSGYGNFATETTAGRVFVLLFGIIGIPFMLSVLANIGSLMAEARENMLLKSSLYSECVQYKCTGYSTGVQGGGQNVLLKTGSAQLLQ